MKLNIKLILSYIFISMFLVISLLIATNYSLEKEFRKYKLVNQEKENLELVETIAEEYEISGKPNTMFFHMLGANALGKGLILTVFDIDNNEVFCMLGVDESACKSMLLKIESNMKKRNKDFIGKYTQKTYDISKNNKIYGTVSLGFYGPFYYQDEDIAFINILNKVLIITGSLFLFVAIGLGIFMARRISRPIKKVVEKTKLIGKGEFLDRIEINTNTCEIAELIYSVNNLADNLENQKNIKKQMARDYAHEFRTPLATLQSNMEAMIDGIFEPTKERLESCNEEVLRLSRMVSNLDKIVEIENKQILLNKEFFDINVLISNIVLNFENELLIKNINLTTNLKSDFIKADKDKINQVVLNLLTNAIKFTEENGEIQISTINSDNKILIKVKDNGVGIEREEIPKIFEHLYRIDKSRTRSLCSNCEKISNPLACSLCKSSGSGIGLSIVKAIVNSHDGNISVKSEIGIGSEFTVILPK